ncbi:MAG: hypothetical protein KGS72_15135 [Cyanobacteria bacterium REEB67]|nr:hypothetical protein [Cyanobacteria bacterium REEB67]
MHFLSWQTTSALAEGFESRKPYLTRFENGNSDYYLGKADQYERKDEPLQGIALCDSILHLSPKAVRAYAIKAHCLIDLKKMPEAWAVLQQGLKIEGNQADTYVSIGLWYEAKKDPGAAIKAYEKSIALNRHQVQAYHALAKICERTGAQGKALKAYDDLVALNPAVIDSYIFRGEYQQRLGNLKAAITDYSSVLARTARNTNVLSKRAYLFYKLGMYQQALADYAKVVQINAYDQEALVSKAAVHHALKQYKEGVVDTSEAMKLDPVDGRAYFWRAKNYLGSGQKAAADADFKKAASLGYRGEGDAIGHPIID